ncbi:MAG: hypothetical protein ACJAQ0_001126 [Dasania sp.]|jgi:hypothetical protein
MIIELFSKRQAKARGEIIDVYTYDTFSDKFRRQIILTFRDIDLGQYSHSKLDNVCCLVYKSLLKEYGLYGLTSTKTYEQDIFTVLLFDFIEKEQNIEKVLDAIELLCRVLESSKELFSSQNIIKKAISDINYRFKENGLGYEYINQEIIRIDNNILHSDIVKPSLEHLSNNPHFKNSLDEFLTAHKDYRHKKYDSALVNCLKSIESTLKIICDKRNFGFDKNAPCSKLIDILKNNDFLHSFEDNSLNHLISLLKSSVPTYRNKTAHGQGNHKITIEPHIASYVFHMTASTLLYLINCDENFK